MSVLIGRDRELNTLGQALHAASQRIGSCVLLTGEAGIGKSRLVAELRARATTDRFLIWEGHCFEQDVSFPYAPWIDALRAFLAPKNPTEIAELLGSLSAVLVKLLPELSLLLPSLQASPPLDPPAEKHRLFESVARLATSLCAAHPLLIIVEDLHWSDEQSLELLAFFVRRIAAGSILILGTYRSEDSSPSLVHHLVELNREHLVEEIQLAPLARAEVDRVAQTVLKTQRPISPEWLDLLMSLTEGNPFFVEEMTRSLAEAGTHQTSLEKLQIPRSIRDMVQRRVAQLPETTRRILSFAAVIGERFDFGLLQEVTGQEEPELLGMLKDMMAAGLVVEETADQFAFRHALTREAVYAMLMRRERKAMHRQIGETLERSVETETEAATPQLAYHFYQAGIWEKAIRYSQRAGMRAQAIYARHEALSHFTQALEVAQQLGLPPPHLSLRGRAQAYEASGQFDRALADFEAVLELARREADHAAEWQARIDLGLLWQSRDLERAGAYYREALDLAHELNTPTRLAQSLNRIGNWHMNQGRARKALPAHRQALELFRQVEDRRGTAQTLELLGIVSYQLGEAIQGAAYLDQAVPIFRELDDRQGLVNALTSITIRSLMDTEVLGEIDYRQLTNPSDEALQIARGFQWYQGEALALHAGAISLEQAGEYGHALERLARAQSMVDETRNRELFARLHLTLGTILVELLALTEAQRHLEKALTLVQELGSGLLMLSATTQLASVALLQSDFARARTLLTDVLPAEYPDGQEPFPQRMFWSVRAELELMEGRPRRALDIVDRLLSSTPNLAQYGPHTVPHLSRLRALTLAALGQMEEAKTELQGTLSVAHRQGRKPLLWRLHTDLGKVLRAMRRRDDAEREFSSARTILQDLAKHVPEDWIDGSSLRDNFLKRALAVVPAAPARTPRQDAKRQFGGLTARERQIATRDQRGKSNREIADELVISEKTAERHVANILSKLGFNSRTRVAVWAVEKGLDK